MLLTTTIAETRSALETVRNRPFTKNQHPPTISLVPTMGAIHAGHLSLVARAAAESTFVTASIFVNPTQFGPHEDFDRYPRSLERDLELFEQAGVDLVFAPSVAEMYPGGASTFVDPGELGTRLDGAARPGHFRGVTTVVSKLFHIVQPGTACFGQKDAVQLAVLRRMVRDLNIPVRIAACPIHRDSDGLALSSRNAYLAPAERMTALNLPRALGMVGDAITAGITQPAQALRPAHALLKSVPNLHFEYLEAVHPDTLDPVDEITPGTLIALAARVGRTRLIDNLLA